MNARSVPKPIEGGDNFNFVQGSTEKHSSSTKSQHTSPLVGSGVLPPKTHQYPKTQTQTASASNKYETTR